jgi:hypothetical protein
MSGYAERVLSLLGWASYGGLIFCLVRMIARRTHLAASERKVLILVGSFGGAIFAIVASKVLADLLPAPFDLIAVLAVGLAALAAFLAVATI